MMQPPPRKVAKASAALRVIHSEHLAKLQAKHQQECDLLEDLRNFTKQRSAIEKTYAEALLKLSLSFLQKKIPSISEIKSDDGQERRTVYALWRTLLDENEKLAKARLAAADVFHHQISESCKAVKLNKTHAAKKCFDQLQRIQEEVQATVRELDKSRKGYSEEEHVAHEARDKALEAEEKLKRRKGNIFQSVASLQKNSAKFSMKREACDIKSTLARNEYLLQLSATNAHQTRYYEHDLPEVIKTLDSEAYERVTEYIQLLSRTEMLTCAATQASFTKILGMADLDRKNTRQYNMECFYSEFPIMKDIIIYMYEPWEGDPIDFVTNDHNTGLSLSKEARKSAARIRKDSRLIRENSKQLKTLLAQNMPGHKVDPNDTTMMDLEQKIDDSKQNIRKSETNKLKSEAKIETLRNAGVNVNEWLQSVEIENLGPFDASAGSLSRSGSFISIKTDVSGNVEDSSSEIANDSFYDSDFNDAASDISGGMVGTVGGLTTISTSSEATPEPPKEEVVATPPEEVASSLTNGEGMYKTFESEPTASQFDYLLAVALYNYEARNPDELSIFENEPLEIVGEGDGDGWIKARNSQGEEGYIPQNYVEMEGGQAVPNSIEPAPASFSSVDYHVPISQPPVDLTLDLAQTAPAIATEALCRALYDYEATCPEELSFVEGQVIHILRKEVCDVDDGWWEGELDGRVGLFPSLVVEELNGSKGVSPQDLVSPPGSAPPMFSPPPMPQYLLPPAQVIITQPTPMAEHADAGDDADDSSAPATASYSQEASGFEMELTQAQRVQYHGQFSSDSEINGEDAAYSQLVSSPDSPSHSPVPQLPPDVTLAGQTIEDKTKEAPSSVVLPTIELSADETSVAETKQMSEEGELEDNKSSGVSTTIEIGEGADVVSVDSIQTDPGSSPSNATGENSIDTVVDLNLNALEEVKEDINEDDAADANKRDGCWDADDNAGDNELGNEQRTSFGISSDDAELEQQAYLPAPVVEVNAVQLEMDKDLK